MGLHKIIRIVALILSIAGIVSLAMIINAGDDTVKATGEGVDGFLYVAYITLALVLFFVLIFVLKGLAGGDIKKTLLSIGVFVARSDTSSRPFINPCPPRTSPIMSCFSASFRRP